MIIRKLNEVLGTDRDVSTPAWQSRRLLTAEDGAPFSFHDTLLPGGASFPVEVSGHFEAVYVVSGKGRIERTNPNRVDKLEAGVLYTVTPTDPHVLVAETEVRMICVFSPPFSVKQKIKD